MNDAELKLFLELRYGSPPQGTEEVIAWIHTLPKEVTDAVETQVNQAGKLLSGDTIRSMLYTELVKYHEQE